jgi:alkanesulfonate monooxygenase SsuD/methylene tetrahydromethanopterin reductase-like flavin-dependent oxidoreductase (luciferase family)
LTELPFDPAPTRPRRGLFLPPFNDMADPRRLVNLAVTAEERGWDGIFLWDHVLRRPDDPMGVADPWVALAAIAMTTTRLRLGTMVTPIVRRRPQVLARQVVTLDHLSGGRVVLGLGLGVDTSGELSRFGEVVGERARGDALDEGAELFASLLAGDLVEHRGEYFVADGVRLLPASLQQPRVPMWFGLRGTATRSPISGRSLRRAARYDGLFLIDHRPGDLASVVERLRSEGPSASFDVAVLGMDGLSPAAAAAAGASWWMTQIEPGMAGTDVEALVAAGPPI